MHKSKLMAMLLVSSLLVTVPLQSAQASYETQCRGEGGSLNWDGVGLRWCCIKRTFSPSSHWRRKVTLWCKS